MFGGLYNTTPRDKSIAMLAPTFPTIVKDDSMVWQGFKCRGELYCKVDGMTPFGSDDPYSHDAHHHTLEHMSCARYKDVPVGYGEAVLPVPARFAQTSYVRTVDALRVENRPSDWDYLPLSKRPIPYVTGRDSVNPSHPNSYQNFSRRPVILKPTTNAMRQASKPGVVFVDPISNL